MKRFALMSLGLLAACESPVVCTAEPRWAFRVTAVSAVDGSPVIDGLTGTLRRQGATSDLEMVIHTGNTMLGGGPNGMAGVYAVTVSAAGYQTWVQDEVRVTAGECGVNRVEITAEMTPE
jgi:hypothetical protein